MEDHLSGGVLSRVHQITQEISIEEIVVDYSTRKTFGYIYENGRKKDEFLTHLLVV